jgi:hypothetical protein
MLKANDTLRWAGVVITCIVLCGVQESRAADARPRLVTEGIELRGDVSIEYSVVELTGIRLDADAKDELSGSVLSVMIVRGELGEPDERGKLYSRVVYDGPLRMEVEGVNGPVGEALLFDAPNEPISTPRRTIYRRTISQGLTAGARIVIDPVEGWFDEGVDIVVSRATPRRAVTTNALAFLVSLLIFGGVLSLARVPR